MLFKILCQSIAMLLLIQLFVFTGLSKSALAYLPNTTMAIDQNNQVYSKESSSGSWVKQIGSPTSADLVASGGSRMGVVASNSSGRYLWAKNTALYGQNGFWSPIQSGGTGPLASTTNGYIFSNGGPQLSIGPSGMMMIIDPAGDTYAQLDNGSNQWIRQTSNGLTIGVAVGGLPSGNTRGGLGRMMLIDSGGTTWSRDSFSSPWIQQTSQGGATRMVAVGSRGEMMLINLHGAAFAKLNHYDDWVKQTSDDNAQTIAVGGKSRMMVIDRDGNAYSKDCLTCAWIFQVTDAKAIAVGSSGRMVVVDSANNVHYKDSTYDTWTAEPLTAFGNPQINFISIN